MKSFKRYIAEMVVQFPHKSVSLITTDLKQHPAERLKLNHGDTVMRAPGKMHEGGIVFGHVSGHNKTRAQVKWEDGTITSHKRSGELMSDVQHHGTGAFRAKRSEMDKNTKDFQWHAHSTHGVSKEDFMAKQTRIKAHSDQVRDEVKTIHAGIKQALTNHGVKSDIYQVRDNGKVLGNAGGETHVHFDTHDQNTIRRALTEHGFVHSVTTFTSGRKMHVFTKHDHRKNITVSHMDNTINQELHGTKEKRAAVDHERMTMYGLPPHNWSKHPGWTSSTITGQIHMIGTDKEIK